MDIAEAIFWYNSKTENLGYKFKEEIKNNLHFLEIDPEKFQFRYKEIRILFFKKFPFGLHYLINENIVEIIAVFHMHQNPKHWDL